MKAFGAIIRCHERVGTPLAWRSLRPANAAPMIPSEFSIDVYRICSSLNQRLLPGRLDSVSSLIIANEIGKNRFEPIAAKPRVQSVKPGARFVAITAMGEPDHNGDVRRGCEGCLSGLEDRSETTAIGNPAGLEIRSPARSQSTSHTTGSRVRTRPARGRYSRYY
jgi:hypothetical protein